VGNNTKIKYKASFVPDGESRMNFNVICYTETECTFITCLLRGVAQTWQDEILIFKGMLRVNNPARAFAAPTHAENAWIFVVYC
jgi:hypothetical protein